MESEAFPYLPSSSLALCLQRVPQLALRQKLKEQVDNKHFGKRFGLALLRCEGNLAQLLWRLKICSSETLLAGELQGKESSLGDDKMGLSLFVICQGRNLGLCIESVN